MTILSKIITKSPAETEEAARALSRDIPSGTIIALYGDLGMGKSTFARALIRALTGDPDLDVPSPTFTLVQSYDSPLGPISHFDCYRLQDPEEIYEIGWEDALTDIITIIEWPERIAALLPAVRLDIRLSSIENNPEHRHLEITRVG